MPNRINDAIRGVKEVRLVGDNVEQGVYSYEAAMRMADDMNLDLVEISANAVPPVCRILDYQKFLYQKKRMMLLYSQPGQGLLLPVPGVVYPRQGPL